MYRYVQPLGLAKQEGKERSGRGDSPARKAGQERPALGITTCRRQSRHAGGRSATMPLSMPRRALRAVAGWIGKYTYTRGPGPGQDLCEGR